MLIAEAPEALMAFAESRGVHVASLDADTAIDLVLDWYASERADAADLLERDGDMLLFQWGTYDWGEGPTFEFDLTRQLIDAAGVDDDAIWQIKVTLYYTPSAATQRLGRSNEWCSHPREIEPFRRFIERSDATAYARSTAPLAARVGWGQAG